MNNLFVNEIFGPTIQGEGKNIGQPVIFLRLSGCNQHCSFCDTPYTWDWTGRNGIRYDPKKETHQVDVKKVVWYIKKLDIFNCKHLVISGGEPMLQQNVLQSLCLILKLNQWTIELETAGTVVPLFKSMVDLWTVSPKLKNSGNEDTRINPLALRKFVESQRAIFKFVVTTLSDLIEIDSLVDLFNLSPVYLMPEGTTVEAVQSRFSEQVVNHALKRGYYLTTRLQILIYGNRRAV